MMLNALLYLTRRDISELPCDLVFLVTSSICFVMTARLQAMAERSPQPMPPERVLQKFNGRLYDAIQSPQTLAEFMYSEELIGDDVISDLPSMTISEGKSKLLSAFRAAIRGSDQKEHVMSRIFLALREQESLL